MNDRELFRQFVGDVEPVKHKVKPLRPHVVEQTPGLLERRRAAEWFENEVQSGLSSVDHIALVEPHDELSFCLPGVQHGVFRKLRLGQYAIDSRLDLHGHTVEQARVALARFISDSLENDLRCVLITHGRGEGRATPALLKSCTNHWLREIAEVLAFHSAQLWHGGRGATYVLLRKSERKKRENWELQHQRGRLLPGSRSR